MYKIIKINNIFLVIFYNSDKEKNKNFELTKLIINYYIFSEIGEKYMK